MSSSTPLFEVRDLEKHYPINRGLMNTEVGRVRAVDGISFSVERGETVGIVGESGCGKSTAATSMIRLEEPTAGEIRFDGEDITEYDDKKLRRFRREVQMIFQDPDSSFNPRMNIGNAVAEPLAVQGFDDEQRRKAIVGDLLERVGLSADDTDRFPHEFSGGQKQRIALARALVVNPSLLVADEPVSALDVSIQSEVLRLIDQFQDELGLAVVVISHDLGVVQEICDRVAVMYLGEFVEVGPTEELFTDPQHPYTRALLSAIPTPDPTDRGLGVKLTGDVPEPSNPPSGCRFHTRCPEVIPPEGIDLPQDTWRSVLHFRKQVIADQVDIESIAEVGAVEAGDEFGSMAEVEAEDIDNERLVEWVREEYELPRRLEDNGAEQTLSQALDELVSDQQEAAAATLTEQFETVCERQDPETRSISADHRVACHLTDESVVGSTDSENEYRRQLSSPE
jgi:peptide/nickel transport system ATP-binding protein